MLWTKAVGSLNKGEKFSVKSELTISITKI